MAPYRLSMPVWCMSCSTSEANGTETCDRDSIKSAADTSKSASKAKTPAGNKKQSDNKKQPENKKTKVYLLHADEGQADKLARPDVQVLIGNVKLRHDSMYICTVTVH